MHGSVPEPVRVSQLLANTLLQKELSALYLALKGQGAAEAGNTGIPDLSPKNTHLRLARLSHVVIVMGTIIWGFGEQFLLWLLCKA